MLFLCFSSLDATVALKGEVFFQESSVNALLGSKHFLFEIYFKLFELVKVKNFSF